MSEKELVEEVIETVSEEVNVNTAVPQPEELDSAEPIVEIPSGTGTDSFNDGDIPTIEKEEDTVELPDANESEEPKKEINPDDYAMDTPEGMQAYLNDMAKANPDSMKMMKGLSDDLAKTMEDLKNGNQEYLQKICDYLVKDGKLVTIEQLDDEALAGFYNSYNEYKDEVVDDEKIKELNLFLSDIKIYQFNKGVLMKQIEDRIFTPDKSVDEAMQLFDVFLKVIQKPRHKPKQVAYICDMLNCKNPNAVITTEDLNKVTKWYGEVLAKAAFKVGIRGISPAVMVPGIETRITTWVNLITPSFKNIDAIKLECVIKMIFGCALQRKIHQITDRAGNIKINTDVYETESRVISRLLEVMIAQSLYAERNKFFAVLFEIIMAISGYDLSEISEENITVDGELKSDTNNIKVKTSRSVGIEWCMVTDKSNTLKFTDLYIEETKKYIEEQKAGNIGTDDEELVKAEAEVKESIIDNLGAGRELPVGNL